jgi:glutathione S-transferase
MTDLILHFEPEGCALVPLVGLETIGHSYRLEVEIPTGLPHRSADAIALQCRRANPTLVMDAEAFSGNVAILGRLTERFPTARLLPRSRDVLVNARSLTDLAFCASTLEPLATRVSSFTFSDSHAGVRRAVELARTALRAHLALVDARFVKNRWWYGDQWSIVDAYVHWVWLRFDATELDAQTYRHLARHDAAMKQRPAVQRALAINDHIAKCLATRTITGPSRSVSPAGSPLKGADSAQRNEALAC